MLITWSDTDAPALMLMAAAMLFTPRAGMLMVAEKEKEAGTALYAIDGFEMVIAFGPIGQSRPARDSREFTVQLPVKPMAMDCRPNVVWIDMETPDVCI